MIGVKNEEPNQTEAVINYIRTMRNKSITATLVSFEKNILNFLHNNDTLISIIPNAVYIDGKVIHLYRFWYLRSKLY